jgi:dephospho-CoA kinase
MNDERKTNDSAVHRSAFSVHRSSSGSSTRKPVIGLSGGIGSGKSFVADRFRELGCLVIDSDQQVRTAYDDPQVRGILKEWWGDSVFRPNGEIDRSAVAVRIFGNQKDRDRLEGLLHPIVNQARERAMAEATNNPQIVAFVWDTPLLFESGLNRQCDAVVFVDTPQDLRMRRLRENRGWDAAEVAAREKLQWPLDKKREIADYIVVNTADADSIRSQVREILSRTRESMTD